jgi:hypothetical protein
VRGKERGWWWEGATSRDSSGQCKVCVCEREREMFGLP